MRSRSIPTRNLTLGPRTAAHAYICPFREHHKRFVTSITAPSTRCADHIHTMRDPKFYCVYIMGSLTGTLYIGVSGNLHRRVFQHKFHHFAGFTDRYDVVRLLYRESYDDVHKALAREKQLKGWIRAKKIALIVRQNPHRIDLASEWYPWMESGQGRDASTANEHLLRDASPPLSMTTKK